MKLFLFPYIEISGEFCIYLYVRAICMDYRVRCLQFTELYTLTYVILHSNIHCWYIIRNKTIYIICLCFSYPLNELNIDYNIGMVVPDEILENIILWVFVFLVYAWYCWRSFSVIDLFNGLRKLRHVLHTQWHRKFLIEYGRKLSYWIRCCKI